MNMPKRTLRILLMQVFLFIMVGSTVFALEQIVNGNFPNETGWTKSSPVVQDNIASLSLLTSDPASAGPCFRGLYAVGAGGSVNYFYRADGELWQTFPAVARAFDTNALVKVSYREVYTGNNWEGQLLGTIRRDDTPSVAYATFLNKPRSGTSNFDSTWQTQADFSVGLTGGNRYRMHFYWNFGCQKSNTADCRIDRISCNLSPSGLTASETTSGGCALSWDGSLSAAETFSNYRVYVGSSTVGPWQRIDSGGVTALNFVDNTVYLPPYDEIRYYAVADIGSLAVESPKSPPAVFKTAKLVIASVEAVPSTVTIGQSGIPVKVYVENTGYSPARLSEIDLYFSDPAVGLYNKVLQTALPIDLPGGSSTVLTFSVDVLNGSIPDSDVLNAAATGSSLQVVVPSPRVLIATTSLSTDTWLIRSPANLVVQKITTPSIVYRDQKDIEIIVEVANDGNKNAAAYWDSTSLQFSLGLYGNIRLLDVLPVAVYPGLPMTARYLVDVNPLSATGTCVVDANITFRDVNLLTPSVNYDGADEPGIWTVVAGLMKTFKGPPAFPSFVIESESFNQGNNIVYARTENLQPLTEQRFRWYNASGTLVRVTDPPLTTDGSGVMTDQFSLAPDSPLGLWRVIATRVTNDTPLAEKQFRVVTPAAISILHQLPLTVTLDQTFNATTTIINSGGAAVDDAYPDSLNHLMGSVNYLPGPTPASSDLPGLGQATFSWQFTATGIGSFSFEGSGYGYDVNDSSLLTAATQSSNICLIQSKPVLSIVSLSENYTNVYRNQTGLVVTMLIRNQGEAAVYVDSATLTFNIGPHSLVVTDPVDDPFLLAGNSDVTVTFEVAIDQNATTGPVNISGSFTGYEANNPASTYSVGPLTINNAWTILAVAGQCAANGSFSPEQYRFNQGQTVFVQFSGITPNTNVSVHLYDPTNNTAGDGRFDSGVGKASDDGTYLCSFVIPTDIGSQYLSQWVLRIWQVQAPSGNLQSLLGEQFFTVQAQGQLAVSLSVLPASVELGENLSVSMSVSNGVASSSTIFPVTPTLPIRAPGYTGEVASYSGPVPASASVSYGSPATFTWIFETSDFTDVGSSFAMVATASGIDLNTTYSEVQRVVTSASDTSDTVLILYRGIELDTDPLDLGTLVCGQHIDFPAKLKNTGNTSFARVIWQKAYPVSPADDKIPYAYFDFTPASGFNVATGTALTGISLGFTIPYNQPPGTYTAVMAVFDDLSGNSARDLGEPFYEFSLKVVASECQVVYVGEDQIELGGYPVGADTASVTLSVFNGGNLALNRLKFLQLDKTFSVSSITVDPNPLGGLATDAIGLVDVSAHIGIGDSGECIATWTVWEDVDNDGAYDGGEASDTFRVRFSVGEKAFTLTDPVDGDNNLHLGNATPTYTLVDFTVKITNTGDLDLINPEVITADLIQGSYSIPKEYLSIQMPDGPIVPGAFAIATITELYIPAGTPIGLFTGVQTIFDDENADGVNNGTANEVANTFVLEVNINPYYSVQVIPSTVDLGGVAPGEPPKSVGFLCRNAGNMSLDDLDWVKNILYDNLLEITPDRYSLIPGPAFSVNFGEIFTATITIELLDTQTPGLYSGAGKLYNSDVIASTSDNFIISCQVGSKAVDILETGPLVATGTPNSLSSSASYRIQNSGSLILAIPRVLAIADLTDGGASIPAAACIFTPSTFDYLSPAQIKAGEFAVQIPAGQLLGTYTGDIRVWDDTNNNFVPDATEASDTVGVEVRVTGKRVLTVTPNPADLFFIPAGQSGSIDLTLKNSGNIPIIGPAEVIRVIKYPLNPVAPGPISIPEDKITFSAFPTSLAEGETATITVGISVPAGQTAGPYEGFQIIFDDYDLNDGSHSANEESCSLLLKLTVGEKKLSVTPAVNLGSGNPTMPGITTTLNASFEVKNLTSIPLSKLKWKEAILVSAEGNTLPVTAFDFSPVAPFNISSNGTKATSASLTIPLYQASGTYTALQTVFEDEDGDNNVDSGEASGTFTLSVTVNAVEKVQVLPSIADSFAEVAAGETTTCDIFVTNIGNVPITGPVTWTKTDLSGAGTISSALVNFDSLPDPFNPGDSATIQVQVGPIPVGQAAGFYSGVQILKGENCELQLNVAPSAVGPALASGSMYQEVATLTFSAFAPETLIFSSFVAATGATGSVGIGFLETLPDDSMKSYNGIVFDFSTQTITQSGADIIDAGAVYIANQGGMNWYRVYMTFNYQFIQANASKTYIILQNATPDAAVAIASYSVWFDGIQLEKAVIPGQTRPTAYGDKGKLISPSDAISIDGKTLHYEW